MSHQKNHRRAEDGGQDNGPDWEGGPPCSGCNSTHVARARTKWKRRAARSERRVGVFTKYFGGRRLDIGTALAPLNLEDED